MMNWKKKRVSRGREAKNGREEEEDSPSAGTARAERPRERKITCERERTWRKGQECREFAKDEERLEGLGRG